jgi:diguanylate cyclase (GGDEF)-like protein
VLPVASHGHDSGFFAASSLSWADNDQHGCAIISSAIRTGTIQLRHDILHDSQLSPCHNDAKHRKYQSAIALPLMVEGRTIGAIAMYAPEPNAFHPHEVQLLEELACDLSFGIETIRLRSAHEQANASIHRLAFFDPLTGLPNKNHLTGLLTNALAEAQQQHQQLALLMLDLDYIREINETYGHGTGDKILIQVSRTLQELADDQGSVTKFGGDDFIIICRQSSVEEAAQRAQRILLAIKQPLLIDGRSFSIGGSIGIALFPDHAANPSDLLARADLAMSQAKKAGGGPVLYKPEMTHTLTRKLDLVTRLEYALAEGNLQLFYQPKVELYAGMLVGAEALLRWRDPQLGWVSPSEFIPVAESRGLMPKIGEWALAAACGHIRTWKRQGISWRGRIAVNVSAQQLAEPYFIERVVRVVEDAGVSATSIELELTESCLMDDPERMFEIMAELRALGFSIAIDDFGTGYSSLAYLKRFPIDTLKIDQSFVQNILSSSNDRAIIATILAIAQQMGLATVAEGVESEEQRQALQNLGCVIAQGYHFSSPEPFDRFTEQHLRAAAPLPKPLVPAPSALSVA